MKQIIHYHKTILLTFIILFLSLYNFNDVYRAAQAIPYADKIVHLLMYFGITLVFLFEHYIETWKMNKKDYVMNFYPLILGGLIEIIQSLFTQSRSGDWYDFIADISGILVANIVFLMIKDVNFFIAVVRFPFKVDN